MRTKFTKSNFYRYPNATMGCKEDNDLNDLYSIKDDTHKFKQNNNRIFNDQL